jgi:flagellar basal body rod protein FlgB
MQNELDVVVSAQAPLPRGLQTIADNVANMNTVGHRATGASFETEMGRAGEAGPAPIDSRKSDQIGAAHLRSDEPIDRAAGMRRSLHRPRRRLAQRREDRRIRKDRQWRPIRQ